MARAVRARDRQLNFRTGCMAMAHLNDRQAPTPAAGLEPAQEFQIQKVHAKPVRCWFAPPSTTKRETGPTGLSLRCCQVPIQVLGLL